ncbi:MAG: tetratricopeptide repeat protein [Desulfuromonadales bacterium]|nr:tetratricopeptide repeat protein [Desulfuromonadales bacterium]
MKYLSLQMLIMLSLASGFLLLGGCAPKTRVVAFTPHSEEISTAEDADKKLENMPLETLISKGISYLEQDNFSLAQLHLLKALTLDPNNVEIYEHLGELFLKMEELDKAQIAFAAVLESNPDDLQALIGMGKINRLKGDCIEAVKSLVQAQEGAPENPEVLTELAICYDTLDRGAPVEKLYLRVTELLPGSPSSFNNLGFHYLIQGDYAQAIAALLTAKKLKPEDRLIKNNLAAAYILSGEESRGLALFENSIGQAGAFNNVGYVYMIQNKWQKAEAAFVKALEFSPRYYVKAAKNLDYLRTLLANQNLGQDDSLVTKRVQ